MRGQIGSERKGYSRGLILGFTMAESMLLLVFCLLLAVGAAMATIKKELDDAKLALETSQNSLLEKEEALLTLQEVHDEMMAMSAPNIKVMIDEDWRELRLARTVSQRLAQIGMTLQEVADSAPLAKAATELGLTEINVADMVAAAKASNDHGLTPEEIAEMIAAIDVLKQFNLDGPEDVAELSRILQEASDEDGRGEPHVWPPIINLSETDGQSFASGSAELTEDFKRRLARVAPMISDRIQRYEVDIVEVIGHTDEQAMSRSGSNMDRGMKAVLDNQQPIGTLAPADNAGLGLARALSVVTYLRSLPVLSGLDDVSFIPMSGGQLIMPGDVVTDGTHLGNDPARRRIEIRVRQRVEQADSQSPDPSLPISDGSPVRQLPSFNSDERGFRLVPIGQ